MYDNPMNAKGSPSAQIRARRKALGLSLSEVARRAGTSPATLSRYENGWTRFELYTLRKLATALDCDLRLELCPKKPTGAAAPDPDTAIAQLSRLFWDSPLDRTVLTKYPIWVVERILEYGHLTDLHMLQALMGRSRFLEAVAQAYRVSDKTRSFWTQILELEGIQCTNPFSRSTVWNS